MAPVTTFVRVGGNSAVPVRFFVNRRAIHQQAAARALFSAEVPLLLARLVLHVHASTRVYLSNNDISHVLELLRHELTLLLFEVPVDELPADPRHKHYASVPLTSAGWLVTVRVDTRWLAELRVHMAGGLPVWTSTGLYNTGRLLGFLVLQREVLFAAGAERGDSDEEVGGGATDTKARLRTSYRPVTILGKGIDIHVLQRGGRRK